MSEPSLVLQLVRHSPHRAVLIVRDEATFSSVSRFLQFMLPHHTILTYEPADVGVENGSIPKPVRGRRLDALYTWKQSQSSVPMVMITTVETALGPQQVPDSGHFMTFSVGDDVSSLPDALIKLGYQRASTAYDIGEYTPRGGLVDVVTPKGAYRFDLFGNTIEHIRVYDAETQKTTGKIQTVTVYDLNPSQGEQTKHLLDFLGNDIPVFTEGNLHLDDIQNIIPLLDISRIPTDLNRYKTIVVGTSQSALREKVLLRLAQHGYPDAVKVSTWPDPLPGRAYVVDLALDHNFETDAYIVLRGEDWCGEYTPRRKSKNESFDDTSSLTEGELIVHVKHGLGRYIGLETVVVDGIAHDFVRLQYAEQGYLLVPIENIDMLSRYGSDTCIALDTLGGSSWNRRKQNVVKRLALIAEDLLKQAAERSLVEAPVLCADAMRYQAFCETFPYRETLDQFEAVSEVLHDMQCPRPMDRLLCGDVGFGKTEVAIRAAFCAVEAGYQVALLTPTSLLCRQHYQTLSKRFAPFHINVENLSRLASSATQTKKKLQDGSCHIVVGTHALLGKDVRFKNLGLVIVDEEHHFGVKQKEKLTSLQRNAHVLTLTATPIPRTLQFSLSGIRELSVIQTPPVDRKHVRTYVEAFDVQKVGEVVMREISRQGQSFVVTPFVENIHTLYEKITKVLPSDVRVAVAHGQLPSSELERVIEGFYDGAYDVLISTNIIESGIDIPRANTIVIHQADHFGLAQLYQLRGRVGRSTLQGFAYFMHEKQGKLNALAQKRLDVLQGLQRLGSGFELARHDMELRGMGNLAGEEQSGHVKDIGVELYQTLLSEAVLQAKAEKGVPLEDAFYIFAPPQMNLGIPILIPDFYISDLDTRLTLYRRIARLSDEPSIESMRFEITDRFGEPPKEVMNLLDIVSMKNTCRRMGVEKIDAGHKGAVIRLYADHLISHEKLITFVTTTPDIAVRPDGAIVIRGAWPTAREKIDGIKKVLDGLIR